MIKLEHLKKVYRHNGPLLDINAEINDGDVIAVISRSGHGKSTLLRCINMLETPTSGHIYIDGEDIAAADTDTTRIRRKTGMVFPVPALFENLTVVENIMLGPVEGLHRDRQEAYDEARYLLNTIGLSAKAFDYPSQLTSGQKQRIAIARTLAMDPEIILMDEPVRGLDPAMVSEVKAVIRNLARSGRTMLIASNDMEFARSVCSRVFYIDEGIIYESGTPEEIFDHPKKEKTIQFIHQLSVYEFTIDGAHPDWYGISGEIEEYTGRCRLDSSFRGKVLLAVEELVITQLMAMYEDPHIHTVIEYSVKTDQVIIYVRYGREPRDFREESDTVSMAILKSICEEISCQAVTDGDYENLATLRLISQ